MTALPDIAHLRRIAARIAPHVRRTPLLRVEELDDLAGCEVWLKAELFQRTGSYKPRGMIHALSLLDADAGRRGVITFSAGNAAAALGYAARVYGYPATAVMPAMASAYKVAATRAQGAEAILHGLAKDAFALMQSLIAERGLHYVPPTDHPDMIEGNASRGLEIHDDLPDADAVFAPIGGGGMVSGVTLGLRAAGSQAVVYGVEPTGACVMAKSLAAGQPVDLDRPPETIADGLAYPFGGRYTFPIVRDHVRRVLVVDDEPIRQAMLAVMTKAKLFVEPSAAAGLAGLLVHRKDLENLRRVVIVLSAGNLDPARLRDLIQA
jgi:threonine dehydratase